MDDTPKIPDESEVVDAEIVDTETEENESPTVVSDDNSTVLTSLDELIKTYVSSLDRLRDEKKKLGEMLSDGFNNDPVYKAADDEAKKATKAKTAAKQQIMNRPGVIELANKLKGINADIKEKQMSLSDYLLEYQRLAGGVNQIEGNDGEVLEIVNSAKLVRKATKK